MAENDLVVQESGVQRFKVQGSKVMGSTVQGSAESLNPKNAESKYEGERDIWH